MEPEPPSNYIFSLAFLAIAPLAQADTSLSVTGIFLIFLIISSGLISASEVAYFSLSPNDFRTLEEEANASSNRILALRKNSEKLLATILISNNFVNIAIVIVSKLFLDSIFGIENLTAFASFIDQKIFIGLVDVPLLTEIISFSITTVLVTIVLLLFGEIAPKMYANADNMKIAHLMAGPLGFLNFAFTPISSLLVSLGKGIENKIIASRNYQTGTSKEDLDAAIELTVKGSEQDTQEADILRGIIKFGELSARQVMKPRVDVVSIDINENYTEVMRVVRDSGYSRIPIYEDDFDHIKGILYVKDLLGHTQEKKDFVWQELIRDSLLYVPESKKIDDLLRDFQLKRVHLAIVVDEFGGTLGIITLEDIMEEVIGEIMDEFDEDEEVNFIKIDDDNYIVDGKVLLNDVCRIIGERTGYFDDVKDNSDSIGGLIIETLGFIPKLEKEIQIKNVILTIISVTNRRIEKVNLRFKRDAHH